MEGFYRKKGGARELLAKRKERVIFRPRHGGTGGKELQAFDCVDFSSPWVGKERVTLADYLIGADRKIPDWLMKIAFLVKAGTAIRLGIKSSFGITGFSASDTVLGLWFFSLILLTRDGCTMEIRKLKLQGPLLPLSQDTYRCMHVVIYIFF